MKIQHTTVRAWALATVAAGALASPAFAQTTTPNASAQSTVGELVVTAQKRSERQIDVPLAVTSVQAQELVTKNNVSLNDYFRSVPGLAFRDNGNGQKQLVIRGVTTGSANTPTVGVYVDDMPVGASTSAARADSLVPDIDPADLERIEVLKGPQGTLYGASNMGGLLKYVTVAPDSKTYSGRIQLDGTSVDDGGQGYGVRGSVNVPLVQDQLAVRLSAAHREDAGWVDNVTALHPNSDYNRVYVDNFRTALRWTPTSDLSVDLSAIYQQRSSHGGSSEAYDFVADKPTYGDLKTVTTPGLSTDTEQQQLYNLRVNYNLPFAALLSSTSYGKTRYDNLADVSQLFGPIFQGVTGNKDFGATIDQRFYTNKLTQEFRLTSNPGKLEWITGAFYTFEQSRYYQQILSASIANGGPIANAPALGGNFVNSHYYELAAFGDVTYHFTDRLSLQGGLRVSYNHQTDSSINGAGILTGDASGSANKSQETVPTFVIAPAFKLSDDTSLYARIASGYRAGGPNYSFSGVSSGTFESDKTVNYEVGVKSYLLDRKAYVELSAFRIDWRNVQILGTSPLHEEFYVNAGDARSQGFEASGQYHPITGLTLAGGLTYTDAKLRDDTALQYQIDGRAGYRLPFTPRWAGSLSADYEFPLTEGWKGSVGADYAYQGDRDVAFQSLVTPQRPRLRLDSYGVFNLRAGVSGDRYSVNAFLKNVADKRGILSADSRTLASTLDQYTAVTIQPRTVGLSLAAKF
jgi:iron complex outermembrane receptor protein